MNNLTPPIEEDKILESSKEIYENIKNNRSKKNQIILNSISNKIYTRYEEYKDKINKLEDISISKLKDDTSISDLLKYCYNAERTPYLQKEIINKRDILRCPYCDISTPDTIDHYVPKGEYPEFSFLLVNLIPCCGKCNNKKNEEFIVDNSRAFINFYYDKIPKENFLKAIIEYDNDNVKKTTKVKYSIDDKNIVDDKVRNIVVNHFKKLNLCNKYSQYVNETLSEITTILENNDLTIDEFKISFNMNLKSYEKLYGNNHWKTVFYKEVIYSDYIRDYLYNLKMCVSI